MAAAAALRQQDRFRHLFAMAGECLVSDSLERIRRTVENTVEGKADNALENDLRWETYLERQG
jgi:hypothetical protein